MKIKLKQIGLTISYIIIILIIFSTSFAFLGSNPIEEIIEQQDIQFESEFDNGLSTELDQLESTIEYESGDTIDTEILISDNQAEIERIIEIEKDENKNKHTKKFNENEITELTDFEPLFGEPDYNITDSGELELISEMEYGFSSNLFMFSYISKIDYQETNENKEHIIELDNKNNNTSNTIIKTDKIIKDKISNTDNEVNKKEDNKIEIIGEDSFEITLIYK